MARDPTSLSPPFARHFSPNANLPHERADQFPSLPMPPIKTLLFERPRDSETRLPGRRRKRKRKRKFARKERMLPPFYGDRKSFAAFDKDRGAVSFRWKWLGRLAWQACSIWEERGGGSIFERSVRFLEKDEKGNVNGSTRVPLHPVRAKSASLFIRGKREISLDCKFHAVHSRRFAH